MPLKLIRTVISNLCNLNFLMLHLFTELTIVGGFLWVLQFLHLVCRCLYMKVQLICTIKLCLPMCLYVKNFESGFGAGEWRYINRLYIVSYLLILYF